MIIMKKNEMNDVRQKSSKRQDYLWHLYEVLIQLVIHEGRLISERTSNFLLFNSILFGGYLILTTQVSNDNGHIVILKVFIPIIALLMCLFQYFIITYNRDSANFWGRSLKLIEKDPDFCGHNNVNRNIDLDIFTARRRYLDGIQTRQEQDMTENYWSNFMREHGPHPNQIFAKWLPVLIAIFWLLGLIGIIAKTLGCF